MIARLITPARDRLTHEAALNRCVRSLLRCSLTIAGSGSLTREVEMLSQQSEIDQTTAYAPNDSIGTDLATKTVKMKLEALEHA